jgi:hypothetical protein
MSTVQEGRQQQQETTISVAVNNSKDAGSGKDFSNSRHTAILSEYHK